MKVTITVEEVKEVYETLKHNWDNPLSIIPIAVGEINGNKYKLIWEMSGVKTLRKNGKEVARIVGVPGKKEPNYCII